MSILQTILTSLATPDAQKRDWYAWATNQCSHTLFGVIVALICPTDPYLAVFLTALVKELIDIYKVPTLSTLKDSIIDVAFWMIGAILIAMDLYLGIFLLISFLSIGIISRIRCLPSIKGLD